MRYIVFFIFLLSPHQKTEAKDFQQRFRFQNDLHLHYQVKHFKSLGLEAQFQSFKKRPSPLLAKFRNKQKDNKRLTASILAFPFPFGIVGLHRIYLGCPPYIPVVYIGTLGGVFGVMPLIDFFVLAFDSNTSTYINNEKVFMWVK